MENTHFRKSVLFCTLLYFLFVRGGGFRIDYTNSENCIRISIHFGLMRWLEKFANVLYSIQENKNTVKIKI